MKGVSIKKVGVTVTALALVSTVGFGTALGYGGGGGGGVIVGSGPLAPGFQTPTPVSLPAAVNNNPSQRGQILAGQVLGASTYNFSMNLGVGSRGQDVTELQKFLTAEGVYTGPITGVFGPLTFAGVKAFQAKYGIQQAGVVGPLTRALLNKGNAPTKPTSSSLSPAQGTAILDLLRSFGADASVIANVSAALGIQ